MLYISFSVNMMSDEYLVECNINDEEEEDDDDEEEDYVVKKIYQSPPPPPQFSSSTSVDIRDPCGVNKHLKVTLTSHIYYYSCF